MGSCNFAPPRKTKQRTVTSTLSVSHARSQKRQKTAVKPLRHTASQGRRKPQGATPAAVRWVIQEVAKARLTVGVAVGVAAGGWG